ncbi:MAG: LON peptidase substrate-binding domain-containing protein [Verrucomicrobiota bacterium]
MIQEIEIPREVPMMTMRGTVLFPQAIMPLYIFEPRYRVMLSEVLESDRIFAVASLDESTETSRNNETPHTIAGVGMVRACRKNSDGTSNLIIQGLARIAVEKIVTEQPFRKARIHQIVSEPGGSDEIMGQISTDIIEMVQTQIRLGAAIPQEVVRFLKNIPDAEGVLDLAIYTLCSSAELKQNLLEDTMIVNRFKKFKDYLNAEIARLKLEQKLKGNLGDNNIGKN